jgi:predicted Zn-dependent protease
MPKQVLSQYEVVKNQFLQDYVQRLGQKLAASPDAVKSGFKFTFTILNVDEVNAFALPGGPMFIYTGLLKVVDNEAQLAGVMGHEMAHVILRHGTHEATKASGIQLLAGGLGAMLGGGSSMGGKLAQAGLGLTANSFILKFSRDAETEADAMGSHMIAESGYDPVQMAKFFQKLAAGGQQPPQILSDHPNPGNRETAIMAEMATLPVRKYGYESGEFARAKKELALVPKAVKKPALPAAAGSTAPAPASAPAAPASGWQEYRGTGFTFSYPPGWQADGSGTDVTMAPRDGVVTKNGATQIGFGAIASLFHSEGRPKTPCSWRLMT